MPTKQNEALEYIIKEFEESEETFYEVQIIISNEYIPLIKQYWDSFNINEQELLKSMIDVTVLLAELEKHKEFMSSLALLRPVIFNDDPNAATAIVNFITQINKKYPYFQKNAMLYSKIDTLLMHKKAVYTSLEKDLAEKYKGLDKINQTWLQTKKAEFNALFDEDIKNNVEFSKKRDVFFKHSYKSPAEFKRVFAEKFADKMQRQEFKIKCNELFKTENKYPNTRAFDLRSLLITRIQRPPRYQLLLVDILKNITSNNLIELVTKSLSIVKDQSTIANCKIGIEDGNDALNLLLNRKSTIETQILPHLLMEQKVRSNINELIKIQTKEPTTEEIEDYLSKSDNFIRMKDKHKKDLNTLNRRSIKGINTLVEALEKQLTDCQAKEQTEKQKRDRQDIEKSLAILKPRIERLNTERVKIVNEQSADINNEKILAAQALRLREHIVRFNDDKYPGSDYTQTYNYDHIKAYYLDPKQNDLELKSLPGKIKGFEDEIKELSSTTQTEINAMLTTIINLANEFKVKDLDPHTMTQETKDNLTQLINSCHELLCQELRCQELETKDPTYKKPRCFSDITKHISSILKAVQEKIKCEQNLTTTVGKLEEQSKALERIKAIENAKKMNLLNAAASGDSKLLKEEFYAGVKINTVGSSSSKTSDTKPIVQEPISNIGSSKQDEEKRKPKIQSQFPPIPKPSTGLEIHNLPSGNTQSSSNMEIPKPEEVSIQQTITQDKTQHEKDVKLLNAAAGGDLQALMETLGSGANINAIGDGKFNAIHLAILFGRDNVIEAMIKAKADLRYKDNQRDLNALGLALQGNNSKITEIIFEHLKLQNQIILNSAATGNLEKLKEAYKAGGDIDTIGGEAAGFCNAIQLAILYGKTEVIPFMLEANADLEYNKNQFKQSAIELATNSNNNEIKEMFKKYHDKSPTNKSPKLTT